MNKPDEVRQLVNTLAENPLLRDRDGDTTGERDTMLLLGGAAINLALIAEAVSKLVEKNPEPTKPVSLRDLTPEEAATVLALREGKIELILNTNPARDDVVRCTVEGEFTLTPR